MAKDPIDEYDDFVNSLDDPGIYGSGGWRGPDGQLAEAEAEEEPSEPEAPVEPELNNTVASNEPVPQAPAAQAPVEEEQAMAEEPTGLEEVVDETAEQEPNPSLLPVFPSASLERLGSAAGTGLAAVGDYMIPPPGEPKRSSTLEANGDDLSDLFEGPSEDDLDVQIDDLVDVDDEDIFGDGGDDMSDLTSVPDDLFDISGVVDYAAPRGRSNQAVRRVVRTGTPMGMGGMQ